MMYLARVQLAGSPTRAQYDDLHQRMERLGFLRTATLTGGTRALPHATYLLRGAEDDMCVAYRDRILAAASSVVPEPDVFVMEGYSIAAYLDAASPSLLEHYAYPR